MFFAKKNEKTFERGRTMFKKLYNPLYVLVSLLNKKIYIFQ